ncbi:MAG: hypothetical protein JHC93_08475 [Parachlamydiales bacterium]|nr:hypothetical protein [Parachlamydiales bacterium]
MTLYPIAQNPNLYVQVSPNGNSLRSSNSFKNLTKKFMLAHGVHQNNQLIYAANSSLLDSKAFNIGSGVVLASIAGICLYKLLNGSGHSGHNSHYKYNANVKKRDSDTLDTTYVLGI